MAYPTLEEIIAAHKQGGPGEVIQSGLEGFMAGRKRKLEENEAKATAVLNQAKLRLQQQAEAREGRDLEAGLIPADKSLTGAEAKPEVQKSLTPSAKEFDKTEIEENGKKFLLFTRKDDPTQHVKIPAGDVSNKGKVPAGVISSALKTSGQGFLNEIRRIEPKLQGFKTPEEQVRKSPSGPVFTGPVSEASARAKAGELTQGQFGGTDPDIVSFEQSRDTAGRRVYKELSGDVGNIAFNEGSFAKVLIPSIYDAPGLRAAKTDRLDRLYKAASDARAKVIDQIKTGNYTEEEASKLIEATVNAEINRAISEAGAAPAGGATQPAIRILRRRPAGS